MHKIGENILITGGAGFIGSVLIQKLMESKKTWTLMPFIGPGGLKNVSPGSYRWNKITVYDNLMYKQTPLVNYCYRGDFEFIKGDVRDKEKLLPYIKEADIIVPLAALVGAPACDKDKILATQVNTDQIKFIVENMKDSAKIIYPNTNSGYGIGEKDIYCTEETPLRPLTLYGKTKCEAEKLVLEAGGVSLRLATVFGVSQRMRLDLLVNDFTYKAYKDAYIVLFEWEFQRNFIHIQDVALVFIKAMIEYDKMNGQAYNVGRTDCNMSKLELAKKIKTFVPRFSIQCDDIFKDPDKRNYIVSNEKLEKLNWKSCYTLDTGIQELLKSFNILDGSLNLYTNV